MESINQIIFSVAKELGVDTTDRISVNKEFLEQINEKNAEWHQLLKSLLGNYQSYFFLKQDKELRIKSKDIWESQKDYFKKEVLSDIEKISLQLQKDQMSLHNSDIVKEIIASI